VFYWSEPEEPRELDFTEIDDEELARLIREAKAATENEDLPYRVRHRAEFALRTMRLEYKWRGAQGVLP
jgi:hypothetical protein